MEASRFPSSLGEDLPRKMIVEKDCAPSCKKAYILDVTLVTGEERGMCKTPLFAYGLGLASLEYYAIMSSFKPELPDRGNI